MEEDIVGAEAEAWASVMGGALGGAAVGAAVGAAGGAAGGAVRARWSCCFSELLLLFMRSWSWSRLEELSWETGGRRLQSNGFYGWIRAYD